MKPKKQFRGVVANFFVWFLIIIFSPLLFLLGICSILYIPIDFIKFKRSEYQKDFPRKYKWLCGTHTDNKVYTVVKQNNLPVTYLKFYEDYELSGDFFYKDVYLNFSYPFFFDEEKDMWLFWHCNENESENGEENEETEINTEDCLTEEEEREYILDEIKEHYPDITVTKAVFFYEEKFVIAVYGKRALEKMRQNDSFVIYKKRKLNEAIKKYIEEN